MFSAHGCTSHAGGMHQRLDISGLLPSTYDAWVWESNVYDGVIYALFYNRLLGGWKHILPVVVLAPLATVVDSTVTPMARALVASI